MTILATTCSKKPLPGVGGGAYHLQFCKRASWSGLQNYEVCFSYSCVGIEKKGYKTLHILTPYYNFGSQKPFPEGHEIYNLVSLRERYCLVFLTYVR